MSNFTIVISRKRSLSDIQVEMQEKGIVLLKARKNFDNTFTVSGDKTVIESLTRLVWIHDNEEKLAIKPTAFWHQLRLVTKYMPLRDEFDPLYTGKDVIVYFADSGYDPLEYVTELEDANIELLYSSYSTFEDILGHGTALIPFINGKTLGISKDAKVKVVKIYEQNNEFIQLEDMLTALDAVMDDHLLTPTNVKVLNCSWTIPKNPLLDGKITEMRDKGLLVVCAAGNTGEDVNNFSPAGLDTIVTVGAVDQYDRVASFTNLPHEDLTGEVQSNFGTELDIFAPGVDVDHLNSHTISGTSVSSAIVSAAACHYIEQDTLATSEVIKSRLIESSSKDSIYMPNNTTNGTPNRILYIPNTFYKTMWTTPPGRLVNVKKNTGLVTVQLDVEPEIVIIESSQYAIIPTFATIQGNSVVIDTNNAELNIYQFVLIAKTSEDYEYAQNFSIGVYEDKETELETAQEVYLDPDGNYYSTYISAATVK